MSLRVNPVLGRELRERMRSGRPFWVVGVFLGLLTLAVYLVYQSLSGFDEFDITRQTRTGRALFDTVILVMTLLIIFFVPGITAASLAGERERQTLQPMQITLLRPRQLLAGKILASMSFLVLLIISALPVLVVCYLLGGIRIVDGVIGIAIVSLLALLLTTIIASLSARAKRVQGATLMAYGVTLFVLLIGPLLFVVANVADDSSGGDPTQVPAFLVTLNPVAIVADAVGSDSGQTADAPLSGLRRSMVQEWQSSGGSWFAWFPDDDVQVDRGDPFPAWLIGALVLAALAALAAVRGVRALRTPAEVER
jgi:ABC-type transport system involved in multi-copper enzyme maturation permease subunit